MRRRTTWAGAMSAVTVSAVTAALVAGHPAGASPKATHAAPATGQQSWVTLVTGDRVLVRTAGGRTTATVDAAPRIGLTQFAQYTVDGDQYVLPADAAGLVSNGTLDKKLFDVSELVRDGYDDAHTSSIPLLVKYAGAHRAALPAAPAGASVRRSIPGLGMAALEQKKATATAFWAHSLTTRVAAGASPSARTGEVRLAPGYAKVWLDGRAHISLDQSVPQIGAPAAWARGFTGRGITVAVLDTGIDLNHPDFAGRIGQTQDFTGSGTVQDGIGHGTHVASIVAGSGAASGGKYRGVAPDATLEVGRVFDSNGNSTEDGILAGMQWAAQSGAKIVNMSLGFGPSDGTDPVSQAVNQLSGQYGTLFVVAAGNDGADRSVSAPAAADSALAVASVTKQDALSEFSSRGPRIGDGAAKPDIAAPGSGIVAAWAAGTPPLDGQPVGDSYQRLSGTSMASPHVAGSAALLLQQHPDWTGQQVKDGLMSTSTGLDGIGAYSIGAGRVDVAHATSQDVTATGSASTYLPWPNAGASKKQTVTWHNYGTMPVTLNLHPTLSDQDGSPAPAGLLTLSADTVTLPAGGQVSVDATVTAQDGHPGQYSGLLVATSTDGTVSTRTTLSVNQEEARYDLTVDLVGRDGAPAPTVSDPDVYITDLDSGDVLDSSAGQVQRLAAGRYSITGAIETTKAGQDPDYTVVTHPELHLDGDVHLTLDARDGKPMSVTPDNPAVRGGLHSIEMLSRVTVCGCPSSIYTIVDPRFSNLYAATVPGTSSPGFAFAQTRQASEPTLELYAHDSTPFEVSTLWYDKQPALDTHGSLTAVDGGAGTPEDLAKIDARGRLVIFSVPENTTFADIYQRTVTIRDAGAAMAMLNVTDGGGPDSVMVQPDGGDKGPVGAALPTMAGRGPTLQRLALLAGTSGTPVSYISRQYPRDRYELAYTATGKLDTAQVRHPKTAELVAVRSSYHDNTTPQSVQAHGVNSVFEFFGGTVGAGELVPVGPAVERTEYFSPGTWESAATTGPTDPVVDTATFQIGHAYHLHWNKAVSGPSFTGAFGSGDKARPWVWRKDGAVDAVLPMFSDSAGRSVRPGAEADSGSISLYRDGQLVGTVPAPDSAVFAVPYGAADYRLVAKADRAADWWPLSTSVSSDWTFRSSSADEGKALPLLTVRYDPDVDIHNRAPGGRAFTFPAYVARQDTGNVEVTSLTVDVSYDDGKTWTPARVTATGDHWNVQVRHPASGYASLRARVTDADGNTVEQTVVRGYQIGRVR